VGEPGVQAAQSGRDVLTVVPADPGAPEALRALAQRTPAGASVTVRAAGRQAGPWSARRLGDCLEGAGFTGVAVSGAVATAVRLRTLADSVRPGLRLLCVGLNPSLVSADAGVAYVGATNRFWPAAVAAGLVPVGRNVEAALAAGVGFTDLVKRATARAASLDPAEYQAGAARVERLVRWLRPDVLAFVGLSGYRVAVDHRAIAGLQPAPFGGRPAYVLPSTSGANAHATLDVLVAHLRAVQRVGAISP
jgi:TDG/mug DNA glycosylase family protein